jgi:restriction endonuclease Mrr
MPIPDFQSMMRPLLQFASDGAEKQFRDPVDYISQQNQQSADEPL